MGYILGKGRIFLTAAGAVLSAGIPAIAQIDNTATATGTHDGQAVESPAASTTVETEPATVVLTLSASASIDVAGGESADRADEGDSVTMTLTVGNQGNVPATGVQPAASLAADGSPGAGQLGAFEPQTADIAPGASQTFTATYTVAEEDILRAAGREAGLAVNASVAGAGPSGGVGAEAQAAVAIAADPRLALSKEAILSKAEANRGAKAEPGDTITYVYTVTNTGNVAISGIVITDVHEGETLVSAEAGGTDRGPWEEAEAAPDILGVSNDAGGTDGSWDLLGAGGAVTFTYVHTVTQAEFEAR